MRLHLSSTKSEMSEIRPSPFTHQILIAILMKSKYNHKKYIGVIIVWKKPIHDTNILRKSSLLEFSDPENIPTILPENWVIF